MVADTCRYFPLLASNEATLFPVETVIQILWHLEGSKERNELLSTLADRKPSCPCL